MLILEARSRRLAVLSGCSVHIGGFLLAAMEAQEQKGAYGRSKKRRCL